MKKRQDLDNRINGILKIQTTMADNIELIAMGEAENDQSIVADAEKALAALKKDVAAAVFAVYGPGAVQADEAPVPAVKVTAKEALKRPATPADRVCALS